MSRFVALLLALATSAAMAQAQSAGGPGTSPNVQTQPAPVVRAYPGADGASNGDYGPSGSVSQITSLRPIPGVVVRVPADASVQTVSADAKGTELRVERGRVNVSVRQPAQDSELLVDLPGGQVSLLKDGFYTFNADTKTVRVLKGEANAYPGPIGPGVKGIKVKEGREVAFGAASGSVRAVDADPQQLWADVLPQTGGGNGEPARGYGYGYGYLAISGLRLWALWRWLLWLSLPLSGVCVGVSGMGLGLSLRVWRGSGLGITAASVAVTGTGAIGGRGQRFRTKNRTPVFWPGFYTADHGSRPVFSVG